MESKKSKILKVFSVIGTIGLIVAMFFIGFFIGSYKVNDDERIVAFADTTEYDWVFKGYAPGASPYGQNVWFAGNTCYYSGGSSAQYMINLTDFTWTSSVWNGYNSVQGQHIWSDGTDYYYSSSSSQYVCDLSTHTWSSVTWSGYTSFNGNRVWSDGTNIYYTYNGNNYLIDTANRTLTAVTFSHVPSPNGQYIWHLGNDVYYSNANTQCVLNPTTRVWTDVTWSGLTNFYGNNIFYDGTNYYCISGLSCYVLDVPTMTWSVSDYALSRTNGVDYFTDPNNNAYYLYYGLFKYEEVSSNGGGSVEPQPNPGSDTLVTYFSSSRIPINVDGLVCDPNAQSHTYIAPPYVGNAYFQFDAWTNIGEDEDLFMIQSEIQLPGMYGANIQFYGLPFVLEDYDSDNYSIVGTDSESGYFMGSVDYDDNTNYKIWLEVSWSNLDNVNFQRVTFTTSVDATNKIVTDSLLCYVDSDTYLEFTFRHYFAGNTAITNDPNVLYAKGWGNRTYWLSTSFDNDSLYQSGYDAGYSNGVSAGSNSGYNSGYATGRGEGYNIGYGAGYNAGASDSQYTFLSLIGAVFDAPVQGFQGLFNFNVLGINMKDFLLGLFSIAIVITVIKFVLIK